MRTGISFSVTSADLDRLRAVINDRNALQKHVWRAQIVLLSAEGLGTNAIMRETGKSKTCVWRWQERFAAEGVAGLLRDKTRPSRIPKLDSAIAARVVALTMEEPPRERTHWTGGAMAEAVGVSVSSVHGGDRRLAVIELGEGNLGVGVDEGLLVDASDALHVADVERVLGAAIAWAFAFELAMRFLFALGLLQRGELAFRQHQAFLGDLGLERLERFFIVSRSWRCQTPRTPAGEIEWPSLRSSLAMRIWP